MSADTEGRGDDHVSDAAAEQDAIEVCKQLAAVSELFADAVSGGGIVRVTIDGAPTVLVEVK